MILMEKYWVRGIRGAVTVAENTPEAIITATRQLLEKIARENLLEPERIISIIFSVTPDLNAAFPAEGARALGWTKVPLFCTTEIAVPGSLPRCVRVLVHAYLTCAQEDVKHVYLGDAVALRPDLF
ncbi:chorismate mutase AroH [Thermacetogenium phaeum DSM 12270]|uniref:chorismate mutase n=2 Tax=Thermacetogenium phaeum TaxID=85874 RepID=K4LIL4_THEPS|nr:chorismate mutase AroH [Thermacetogenium phaeum DSM 12270]